MSIDKEIALNMRREGKSYNDIERQLHIPKSTLSGWLSGIDWSETVKVKLNEDAKILHKNHLKNLSKDRGEKLKLIYDRAEREAVEEYQILKQNPLFIAGLMIYWGEGNKSSKTICSISNSEPNMLRLFTLFLERVCGIQKTRIKAWILAYPDIDQIKALEFWSRTTTIWPSNFYKTTVIQGKSAKRRLPFGVCTIKISSSYLKKKIVVWIGLMSKELIK